MKMKTIFQNKKKKKIFMTLIMIKEKLRKLKKINKKK